MTKIGCMTVDALMMAVDGFILTNYGFSDNTFVKYGL